MHTVRTLLVGTLLMSLAGLPLSAAQSSTQSLKKKAPQSKKPPAIPPVPELEPKAIELLKAASHRLAAAHSLSFTAVEFYESSSRQGHPLAYTTRSEVTLQRPDRLRVIMSGDGPASEFYYDGKTMMALAPAENLAAFADAPPTIDATLESAYHSAGIYFPFADLIVADPYKDMAEGLQLAYYIGQSHVVGGTTTDMVACVDNGVFEQIWIGAEDNLPRMVRAVYLEDPERLRHELVLSDWQLDPAVSADAFGSSKAASAKRIQFAHPHPQPQPGAKPTAKGSAPKAQQ